jgi:hypothetical protein
MEQSLIKVIEKKNPRLIIDTSPEGIQLGFSKFGSYARFPYSLPPLMKSYIDHHYTKSATVDGFAIYTRNN